MNKCFFSGKVITDIRFDFILNGYNDSVARFKLELFKGEIIDVNTYDDLADYCFKSLQKDNIIALEGYLTPKYVVANRIEKMRKEEK